MAKKKKSVKAVLKKLGSSDVVGGRASVSEVIFSQGNEPSSKKTNAAGKATSGNKNKSASDSLDPTSIYLKEIGFHSLLTAKEEITLSKAIKKGSDEARQKMIECNLRLVVKIARYYCNRGVAFMDLIAEGNIGLMTAVKKFDHSKGFRFSTYATWWIRQTIERYIMNQGRMVRLPVHVIKELNVYLRLAKSLTQQLDHEPSNEEIAALVDRPVEEVHRMMSLTGGVASLDVPVGDEGGRLFIELIEDTSIGDPVDIVENIDFQCYVESLLVKLKPRCREIIARRFGLLGFTQQTLEEVGVAVGLTRERVRQLQLEGLRDMKRLVKWANKKDV